MQVICNLKFPSNHILKGKKKQVELFFFNVMQYIQNILIYNQYNMLVMAYFIFFYIFLETQCVFYTYSTSQFGLNVLGAQEPHVDSGCRIGQSNSKQS